MEGKAGTKGTEHNQFHAVLEDFWDLFRKDGAREGQVISNKEYLQVLRQALAAVKDATTKAAKFTERQINEFVEMAEKELTGNGYHDGPNGFRPEVPQGSTGANK